MRPRPIAAIVFSLGLTALLGACTPTQTFTGKRNLEPKAAAIGDVMLEINLETLTGKPAALSSFKGQPILLNFWATWCGPCKAEMPALNAISKRYSAKGLKVIGVDVGERRNLVETFLKQTPVEYDIWLEGKNTDDTETLVSELEGKSGGYSIPLSIFIDKRGLIFSVVGGADVAQLEFQAQAITK